MRLYLGRKFKMSPYLQSRGIFLFFLFFFIPPGVNKPMEGDIFLNETDECSGGSKASLTDTSTLTLDRLEDISQHF